MSNDAAIGFGVLAVLLALLVIGYGPWILFWCIETLFGYDIDVTLRTWFAANLLMALLVARGTARDA